MKWAEYILKSGYYIVLIFVIADCYINGVNSFDIVNVSLLSALGITGILFRKNYIITKYFYFMIAALLVRYLMGITLNPMEDKDIYTIIGGIIAGSMLFYFSLKSLSQRKFLMNNKGSGVLPILLKMSMLILFIQLFQIVLLYQLNKPIFIIISIILLILLMLNVASLRNRKIGVVFTSLYCIYSLFSIRITEAIHDFIYIDTEYKVLYSHFFKFSQIGYNGYYIIDDLLTYEYLNIFLSVALAMLIIKKDTISNEQSCL